jgi:sucrose-6-phosphate hydrolase SacC (GH32 family)
MGCYVMALYLANGDFCLLRSDDLLNWDRFCDFRINGDRECPNIECFPVYENGRIVDRKWVIFGALGAYIVGHFDKNGFIIDQDSFRPCTGSSNYAGQLFVGTGDEVILIDWMRSQAKNARFSQSFSLPYRLTLVLDNGRYFLCRDTVRALDALMGEPDRYSLEAELMIPMPVGAYEVCLSADYPENGSVSLNLFGNEVKLNSENNTVSVGRSTCPISSGKERIDLRVIIDRYSLEIFADGGRFFFSACPDMDENITHMTVNSQNRLQNAAVTVRSIRNANGGRQ